MLSQLVVTDPMLFALLYLSLPGPLLFYPPNSDQALSKPQEILLTPGGN